MSDKTKQQTLPPEGRRVFSNLQENWQLGGGRTLALDVARLSLDELRGLNQLADIGVLTRMAGSGFRLTPMGERSLARARGLVIRDLRIVSNEELSQGGKRR